MKYVDEYRDKEKVQKLLAQIKAEVRSDKSYRFMEFCGGHTHAIYRYGLPDLLPEDIKLVHGPGCPVCVLPMAKIDEAIQVSQMPNVTLCTYGDMMRVPGGNRMSLIKARSEGANVQMVTSPTQALQMAIDNQEKEIVFFAIGFATTLPGTAHVLNKAIELDLSNFTVFCNHVLLEPPLRYLLESCNDQYPLDGFLGPGHAATVTGTDVFNIATDRYSKPVVASGFEPVDLLMALLMLVRQVNDGRSDNENAYERVLPKAGNKKLHALEEKLFDVRESFAWRGLGEIPKSALKIKDKYAKFDAEKRYDIKPSDAKDNPACKCPAVLRGECEPQDCKLFGKACTPENPIGACMVSSEGGCAAAYSYGRQRIKEKAAS